MPGEDRRVHERYRLWLPARIEGKNPDGGGVVVESFAIGHDFSQGGSLLVTESELSPGQHITLHVHIPPDSPEERCIGARVLRCDRNTADPNGLWPFRIAVEFDEPNPELEKLLREQTSVLEGMADSGQQASR